MHFRGHDTALRGLDRQIPYRIHSCLLYTSDAADDLLCVDLGGRRIIKKKNASNNNTVNPHSDQSSTTTQTTE